jgi:CRISPR-associated protein Csm1
MEKYFTAIPCQVKGLESVSLFDFMKSVAGLANILLKQDIKQDKPFLFIKGDLSGIQKFIYADIDTSEAGRGKGTAKNLRGKSFYIALLTDFLAEESVKSLGLGKENIMFSGGGHFNIVAPNTEVNRNKVEALDKEVNLMLLEKIGTVLSLNLVYLECADDLYQKTNEYFFQIHQKLDKNKNHKYKAYLKDVFQNFEGKIKSSFKDYMNLGKAMPYSDYLVEFTIKEDSIKNDNLNNKFIQDERMVANFLERSVLYFMPLPDTSRRNKNYASLNRESLNLLITDYGEYLEGIKIIKINDINLQEDSLNINNTYNIPISLSFRFVGNECHKNENGDVATFEDIAKINFEDSTKPLSYPQLAVMRLDVDNLGGIFAFGLGNKVSFAKVATMSRQLHIFFSGYMNVLAKNHSLYITYSGGDDAFIIGSWYNMIHFAQTLCQDFKDFACLNKHLSFSAGMFMCHENYPVAKFAEDAAEAEHLAKSFEREKNDKKITKDAIHLFDHSLDWDSYKTQIDFAEKSLTFIEDESLSTIENKGRLARAFVHRLLRMIKSVIRVKDDGSLKKGTLIPEKLNRNIAQLHYLFARRGFNQKKLDKAQAISDDDIENADLSDKIGKLVVQEVIKNFSEKTKIKDYLISTQYILLKTRKL